MVLRNSTLTKVERYAVLKLCYYVYRGNNGQPSKKTNLPESIINYDSKKDEILKRWASTLFSGEGAGTFPPVPRKLKDFLKEPLNDSIGKNPYEGTGWVHLEHLEGKNGDSAPYAYPKSKRNLYLNKTVEGEDLILKSDFSFYTKHKSKRTVWIPIIKLNTSKKIKKFLLEEFADEPLFFLSDYFLDNFKDIEGDSLMTLGEALLRLSDLVAGGLDLEKGNLTQAEMEDLASILEALKRAESLIRSSDGVQKASKTNKALKEFNKKYKPDSIQKFKTRAEIKREEHVLTTRLRHAKSLEKLFAKR
jgi:hypothetical protein